MNTQIIQPRKSDRVVDVFPREEISMNESVITVVGINKYPKMLFLSGIKFFFLRR